MTVVVNMRGIPTNWQSDKRYVYIGRAGNGEEGYFGNPYPLKEGMVRGDTLKQYETYLQHRLETDPEFNDRFYKLKDKYLVCFCKPEACHGDIMKKYLDAEYRITPDDGV